MNTLILAICLSTMGLISHAQVQSPVNWSFSSKKISVNTFEVHLTAIINSGWHTYSQTTPDGGPVPVSISFAKNPLLTLQGTAKEVGKLEQHHEPLFGADVKQFSGKVDFVQTIVVKGKAATALSGNVEYMTCNDHECLPPVTQKFSISIK